MNKFRLLLTLTIAFTWLSNIYSQDCNITSKANDILPDKLCAPVSLTWEVTYRGVNDAGTLIEIQVDWDDGNPVEVLAATNTNAALQEWQVTFTHVYPIGGDQCNYQPEAMLIVNGVLCTSSIQVQNVTVWDTDDYNGGQLQVDPQVFPICVGNADGTVFNDVSIWNCTPAGGENDNINSKTRWTQWVYGTNNGAGNFINNATVGGTLQAYPYWDAVVEATEYVDAPQPPNNVSEFCFSPLGTQVGDEFEVTLRNWNYCNPYDDPTIPGPPADLINGDHPPLEITAIILIVDTPLTNITPAGPFCENDNQVWLNGTPGGGVWSGPGTNNNGRFRPWVAGPGTHTITYTTTDPAYGCDGTASIQIEVYAAPDPDILPGPTAEVCPGDVLNIDGNPTPGDGTIISHLWTGDTAPLNFTNIQDPSFTTNTQGLYNLTYTVEDDNGCTATDNIAITVNPVSANIIPDPAEVCLGEDLILNGNPSGGTGNYITHVWTGDVANLNTTNTQSVTFNSSVLGNYNFTYTVTDDNGCTGNDDIVVTVFDVPVADAGLNDSTCSLNLNLNAIPSIGNGLWMQLSGPGTLSFDDNTLGNTGVTADQYGLYEIIWQESFGPSCIDQDTVEVRFTEQPVADAGPDGGICGYVYQLEAQPSVGTGYWSVLSGAGTLTFNDSTLADATITSDVYGDYELIWHEDNGYGCIDQDTVNVSFNLVPTPAFSPINPDGCTPFTVDFTNESTGGTTYSWNFGNGNTTTAEHPSETFYNSSSGDITYNVTLIVNNPGCGDTITQTVTVHPLPFANFTHNGTPKCSPSTVDFVNQSVGSVLHIWDFDDATPLDTGETVSHVFINDTVFIVNYAVDLMAITEFGCVDTATDYITVYPNPNYEIVATPDSSCHPTTVEFSTSPSGQTYSWDFGNGTAIIGSYQSGSQYNNFSDTNMTYDIELIVTSYFGCIDTTQTQIVVHPSPYVDFNITQAVGCAPFEAEFINISTGTNQSLWDFGDGTQDTSTQDTVYHTFQNNTSNPITYYVDLSGSNTFGCANNMQKTILVYPEIHADISADTADCHPFSNQMVNLSTGASSYIWDFGDGTQSTLSSPVHLFNNTSYSEDTSFTTVLTAFSTYGCSDTDTLNVSVYPQPIAQFTLPTESGCTPYTQSIINNSLGGNTYLWNFGDGDTSSSSNSNLEHIYINNQATATIFTISLDLTNTYGCADQMTANVEVFPEIHAEISADTSGCHPFENQMVNLSSGADTYSWNFGDGSQSTLTNPVHVYNNNSYSEDTSFTTILTTFSSYGCSDADTLIVSVYPQPIAQFTLPTESGCTPYTQSIINSSLGGNSYLWNFGDGDTSSSSSPNLEHIFINDQATPSVFSISLNLTNTYGCSDQMLSNIEVYPKVESRFLCDTAGCSPFPVDFINQSSGATTYSWNLGNGLLSNEQHPSYTYENLTVFHDTILVELIALSDYNCSDTSEQNIVIYATPNAQFDVQPSQQNYPATGFAIANQTTNGNWDWSWRFGDGNTSDEFQPGSHTYDTWGTYDIWLTVSNEFCTDSVKNTVKIIAPEPTADFEFSPQQGCIPLKVTFSNLSLNAENYYWDFGDGYDSEAFEPVHVYYDPGIYYINLTAAGENGSHDITLGPIRVFDTPEAHFEVSPQVVYIPDQPIKCFNLSVGEDSVLWHFGDGNTSTEENPLYYYQEAGQYTISLIAMTENMCMDTAIIEQAVEAKAQGDIDFPNAFKPSGSGPNGGRYSTPDTENIVFHPVFRGVKEYELNIFNRWGELVFVSKDINIGWDGYYRGKLCKQDVYVWKVEGKYIDGSTFNEAGDLTLLR